MGSHSTYVLHCHCFVVSMTISLDDHGWLASGIWDSWSFAMQLLLDAMINENSCQTIMHASCMYVHSRDMWDWNAKKAVWPKPDCPDKFRCPCHVIEKEILVHPTLAYTSPQWTGSSTKIRGKLLIEDQGSGNGGNIRPSQTW